MSAAEFDVAVVGGGVAGLAAASALAEAGKRVVVLEARGALGGRATAFRDRVTGELVDNGQHVLFGCYRHTFKLLRRIGAAENVRIQDSLEVPYFAQDGNRSVLKCPRLPAPFHLLAGLLTWDALPLREKIRALAVGRDLMSLAPERLHGSLALPRDATVADWLNVRGQRGRIREWLWEPLAVAALNESPGEAGALAFLQVLWAMFQGNRTDSSIALATTPLDEMYANPAKRYIEARGGEVRTNALARITLRDRRIAGIDVRGDAVAARSAIAAVPWHALAGLVQGDTSPLDVILANAGNMTSRAIVTVNLWYNRTVMQDEFVGLPGRQMQWVFDKRRAFGESASHLSLVASGADALVGLDADRLIATAAAEVAASIPGARDAVLLRGTVVREKRATFSVAPGQPPRPAVDTPVAGLYLAGDWIDTGLPGTIESAALAGHRAAHSAIDNLNRQSSI